MTAPDITKVVIPREGHWFIDTALTAARPDTATLQRAFLTAAVANGTVPTGFTKLGHTVADTPYTLTPDGGDQTVTSTWQGGKITDVAPTNWFLDFSILQRDTQELQLYFGGGTNNATTGYFELPKTYTPVECALVLVIPYSSTRFLIDTYDRVTVKQNGAMTGSPLSMPIRATLLGRDADSFLARTQTLTRT